MKAVFQGIFRRAISGTRTIGSLAPSYIIFYNASTKYASWTVEKKVCSKLWPAYVKKSRAVCRWCNFQYDIRADITSRLDGNVEK